MKKQKNIQKNIDAFLGANFDEYVDFIISPWKTFFFSFLRGTATGLGMVVGVALVIAILTYVISIFGGVPVIGEWMEWLGGIIKAR